MNGRPANRGDTTPGEPETRGKGDKRVVKKASGRGQITKRDERIWRDLYHTRILSIEQVALMHFRSYARARRRLYDQKYLGMIENKTISAQESPDGKNHNVWRLNPTGIRYVLNDLGKEEKAERLPDWPSTRNLVHYLDTNDLYVLLSGELDAALGQYPAWEWKDERRASRKWNMGGKERTHRPDAEVCFGGGAYFIERETKRAKEPPSHFLGRMEDYAGYIRYARANGDARNVEVLWACDTERDMDHAVEAGQRFGVATYAGTPHEVCQRLLKYATNGG